MKNVLLNRYNLQESNIFLLLNYMSENKVDFGDIYFQLREQETWVLEKSIIKKSTYLFDEGVGIRVIKNCSTFFSCTNVITLNSLMDSTKIVCKMIPDVSNHLFKKSFNSNNMNLYTRFNSIQNFSIEKKIYTLNLIDQLARNTDHRITDVYATLTCEYEEILIGSTDSNILSQDVRPLVRITIRVMAEQNGIRENGCSGGGGRLGFQDLLKKQSNDETLIESWTKEAVRIALISLSAKSSISGAFPVILGSGWPGILFHEAVGHGLEGDFIRKKTSIFTKKMGKIVASNLCTVVDNGTLKGSRGSINIDDEGTPSKYNILIDKGILRSFLQDKLNSHLMGSTSTGNGRRDSYSSLPMPRMTNTYLLPGKDAVQDIILSLEYGIYAVNFSDGQVDITSGNFVFTTSEAYLVKKGKILYPLKSATLIGSGIEVMKLISMVGNDLRMDNGLGCCGKNGQNIPVCVGQPTIRVDKLTVGGSS
ncbi:metalloprotease TldD [Buchnera aphidicola]|uniref:metalloprotease TldD n=1 Tax=Buchnera aphidicola TaxID=9 RepID=UPI001FCC6698|nr:metalloprotease TldD [Buchnera aphidicola]